MIRPAPSLPWAAILRALLVRPPLPRSPARHKRRRPWPSASEGSQGRATCRWWRAHAGLLVTPALDTFSPSAPTSASRTTRGLAWQRSRWPAWRTGEQRPRRVFMEQGRRCEAGGRSLGGEHSPAARCMVSTTPLLCPRMRRRRLVLVPFGQEFSKFLLQAVGHRGRLGGAIGQHPADVIEDIPDVPFVLRHPEVLGRAGAAVVLGPLPIERTEQLDRLRQAPPPAMTSAATRRLACRCRCRAASC